MGPVEPGLYVERRAGALAGYLAHLLATVQKHISPLTGGEEVLVFCFGFG